MTKLKELSVLTIAGIIKMFIAAYVFMRLWAWFVVYAFHVQPLTFIQSIGLGVVCGYLLRRVGLKPEDPEKEYPIKEVAKNLFSYISTMYIYLFVGYVITLFQ